MKNLTFYLLLCLTSGLFAQQNQTHQNAPKPSPAPTLFDPAQLNDFEPPTVVCLNGLSANLMQNGILTIQVTDLLGYVEDNVTPTSQIQLGVRREGTGMGFPLDAQSDPVLSLSFNCDDLGSPITLELWAMDAAGNAAFCNIPITLEDIFGACGAGLNLFLCAKAICSDEVIEEAVFVVETPPFVPNFFGLTNLTGCAYMVYNEPFASTFTIKAQKADNPLNGVDEQDFTLLSNHINGTQPFTEPWQWVAADVNRDGQITLEDSIELRHLMLGIYQELPKHSSWRFIPKNYEFPVPNPLSQPLPESITFGNLILSIDTSFWGIKIGDLNCSAAANFTSPPNGSRNDLGQQEKTAPPVDPTQLQPPPPDSEPPTVVCLNALEINLFSTGLIHIWASDLLVSLDDNETPVNEIKIGIRKSGTGTGFPIDSLGNSITQISFSCLDQGVHSVELWAIDLLDNSSYCETTVFVGDTLGYCDPTNYDTIQICLTAGCDGAPIEGATFNLSTPFATLISPTGPDGCTFGLAYQNSIYTISLDIEDDPLNGLSTYDLLLISQHITGIAPLDNPYKMIAADANKSGSITNFDLVELRKLIMGIYTVLPNNTSWRFVDAHFGFPNPFNPFTSVFPETIFVNDTVLVDSFAFVGVKIGDVDCSVNLGVEQPPPNYPVAFLTLPDTLLLGGQEYEIPIYMAESGVWLGYQFVLGFDSLNLVALGTINNAWSSVANWNLSSPGRVTSSWSNPTPVVFDENTPIGSIRFRALQTGLLKDFLSIETMRLNAEAYFGVNAEKRNLQLEFVPQFKASPNPREADNSSGSNIAIGLPQPNPTHAGSIIPVHLPQAETLRLELYDLNGKRLWFNDVSFDFGNQVLDIPAEATIVPGMYVWRVCAGDVVKTGKLLRF